MRPLSSTLVSGEGGPNSFGPWSLWLHGGVGEGKGVRPPPAAGASVSPPAPHPTYPVTEAAWPWGTCLCTAPHSAGSSRDSAGEGDAS